ncbi:YkvA family protein [Marinobacter sp.]|uniref:YkvA family protein n=1 Tax=Marinobacter sp. TaxID=50741 RepID=UPI00384A74DF
MRERTISKLQAEDALQQESDKIHEEDLDAVLATQAVVERKAERSGRLRRFLGDIRVMFQMLQDYWRGEYRAIPWLSIAAMAGALLYVFNPMDLIPDLIAGFGLFDDATVIAACLTIVRSDMDAYLAWKAEQKSPSVKK